MHTHTHKHTHTQSFGEDKEIYIYLFIVLAMYNFFLCFYAVSSYSDEKGSPIKPY